MNNDNELVVEVRFHRSLAQFLVEQAARLDIPVGEMFSRIIAASLTVDTTGLMILSAAGEDIILEVNNADANVIDVGMAVSTSKAIVQTIVEAVLHINGMEILFNNVSDDGDSPSFWRN